MGLFEIARRPATDPPDHALVLVDFVWIVDENTWWILAILGVTSKSNTMKTNHTMSNKSDPKTTKLKLNP